MNDQVYIFFEVEYDVFFMMILLSEVRLGGAEVDMRNDDDPSNNDDEKGKKEMVEKS